MIDWTMILSLIQSIGVITALFFTAYEIRRRRKEQQFRNYLDGISGFVDDTKLLIENTKLQGLYNYTTENITQVYEDLTDAQRARVHYCDSIIARCETVWLASEKGWVAKDEWRYWRTWIQQLGGSAEFRWTVDWVVDDYDEEFMKQVREDITEGVAKLKALANNGIQQIADQSGSC